MRFDYTTLGHVTVDVMADGTRRPGGGAFYSALQAARLGLRTLILTQGSPPEIEDLLAPFAGELELLIRPAARSTALATSGTGGERRQRLLSWAGEIAADVQVDAAILHLAPVARETPSRWRGRTAFVGLTPQGLTRAWPAEGGELRQIALDPSHLPARCDAIVLGERERASCASLLRHVGGAPPPAATHAGRPSARPPHTSRPVIAVTAACAATQLHTPGAAVGAVPVPAIDDVVDDLGAGDVFAAAFFVALHEGAEPEQAARVGHAAAAVRIGAGGPGAVGHRAEIEARLGVRS
jgi:1D-myo-inositol 3-kinase